MNTQQERYRIEQTFQMSDYAKIRDLLNPLEKRNPNFRQLYLGVAILLLCGAMSFLNYVHVVTIVLMVLCLIPCCFLLYVYTHFELAAITFYKVILEKKLMHLVVIYDTFLCGYQQATTTIYEFSELVYIGNKDDIVFFKHIKDTNEELIFMKANTEVMAYLLLKLTKENVDA